MFVCIYLSLFFRLHTNLFLLDHEEVTSCFETAIESGQFDLALYFIKQAGLTDKKHSTKLMFRALAHFDIVNELIENMHYDPKGDLLM